MTTPNNAADTTGGDTPIPEPITEALNRLRKDADHAQLHAPRSPYAMGARDALDKALHTLTQALHTTYAPKNESTPHDHNTNT